MVSEFFGDVKVFCCSKCFLDFKEAAARNMHQLKCFPSSFGMPNWEINIAIPEFVPRMSDLSALLGKPRSEVTFGLKMVTGEADLPLICDSCGEELFLYFGCKSPTC